MSHRNGVANAGGTISEQQPARSSSSLPRPPRPTYSNAYLIRIGSLIIGVLAVLYIYASHSSSLPPPAMPSMTPTKVTHESTQKVAPTTRHHSNEDIASTSSHPVIVDPILDSELSSLVTILRSAFSSGGNFDPSPINTTVAFEIAPSKNGPGIRAIIRPTTEIKLASSSSSPAASSLDFPSTPLIAALRRLGLSDRYIATGDPTRDDPRNSFFIDHKHCNKQRRKGNRKRESGADYVSQRCRTAEFESLEHLWTQHPQHVWGLLRQIIMDGIENAIQSGVVTDRKASSSSSSSSPFPLLRQAKLFKSGRVQVLLPNTEKKTAKKN